jgi:hypothetical protein
VKGSILLTMGKLKMRETRVLDMTVKAVCATCNQGWLSDLEAKFAAKMLAAIAGKPVQLASDEQEMVAIWATKTWLLLEKALRFDRGWAFRDPGILPFLYRERHLPREMSVSIGGLLPGHDTLAWLTTMTINDPPVGIMTIYTIGNLVFHMHYPFPPVVHRLAFGPLLAQGFIQIWPTQPESISLPPAKLFDIEDMDRIWQTGSVEIPIGSPP